MTYYFIGFVCIYRKESIQVQMMDFANLKIIMMLHTSHGNLIIIEIKTCGFYMALCIFMTLVTKCGNSHGAILV